MELIEVSSGDGVDIGLAIHRDFLTQKSRFVLKDTDAGPCEAGAVCKLYCIESILRGDFMDIIWTSFGYHLIFLSKRFRPTLAPASHSIGHRVLTTRSSLHITHSAIRKTSQRQESWTLNTL